MERFQYAVAMTPAEEGRFRRLVSVTSHSS